MICFLEFTIAPSFFKITNERFLEQAKFYVFEPCSEIFSKNLKIYGFDHVTIQEASNDLMRFFGQVKIEKDLLEIFFLEKFFRQKVFYSAQFFFDFDHFLHNSRSLKSLDAFYFIK